MSTFKVEIDQTGSSETNRDIARLATAKPSSDVILIPKSQILSEEMVRID
jgi:hypothetical protein